MAIHAGRTKCQNRMRNLSSKAEWEVQDPKHVGRTKFQNMLGEPSSKTQVPTPKFQKSKSPKWIAALLLPLRLLLRGSATDSATGTATSTATSTTTTTAAATVLLHATTQTHGEPRLASTELTFQKRFDSKLYSVASSRRGPYFLSGKPL